MITEIPSGQICQAFDPMMYLPEKTSNIIIAGQMPNTSCVAPAFVYIEGVHGKRFLCDFHYHYEKNMTLSSNSSAHLWPHIESFKIDERERIKETFSKNVTTTETLGHKCSLSSTHNTKDSCTNDAFLKIIPRRKISEANNSYENPGFFYCNFHFRKNYYRYYSNGVKYEEVYHIIDERYRMSMTIIEESDSLTLV